MTISPIPPNFWDDAEAEGMIRKHNFERGYYEGLKDAEAACRARSTAVLVPAPAYGPLESAALCADTIAKLAKEFREQSES